MVHHSSSNGHTKLEIAQEKVVQAKDALQESISDFAIKAQPTLKALEEAVRRKPGSAMLIAAGLGTLLALGLRRWR